MALLSILGANGASLVRSGRIDVPRQGVWTAYLRLDAPSVPVGSVQLVWDGVSVPWRGMIVPGRAGLVSPRGAVDLVVVGGAGGLSRTLAGQSYRNTSARVVLEQLLGAASERLSPAALPSVVGRLVTRWSRASGPAGAQLAALASELAVTWRVLVDGTVWLGLESGVPLQLPQGEQPTDRHPTTAGVELAWATPWTAQPGMTFEGRQIEHVTHHISPERVRTDLCLA